MVYDKFVEKLFLKIEENPYLRSHPLAVVINGGVNIKTFFKYKELE
jgi:hypothetical protein